MNLPVHHILQCPRPTCRFRFPVSPGQAAPESCPKCGAPLRVVEAPYEGLKVEPKSARARGPELEVLLDNIRSTFNVGAMFRSADGAGVRHVHLAGLTPTPDHPKVGKTALGAEYALPWTQHWDALALLEERKASGMRVWALEGGPLSQSLFDIGDLLPGPPILLVVGNEVSGVDPGLLQRCERVVSIPMLGVKESLNVAIAFGIAVYFLRFGSNLINPEP